MAKPFVWIALDDIQDESLGVIGMLDAVEGDFGFKVNLDFVLEGGLEHARSSLATKRKIFVDLKMWNGQRTMARVFTMCDDAGISVVNTYALAGGEGTTREEGWELKQAIAKYREKRPGSMMQIYAVTILSHYGEDYVNRFFGDDLVTVVELLTEESIDAGADGVIMSGSMAEKLAHLDVKKVLTGYRPDWYQDDRHSESFTPQNIAGLSDIEIVCGSPIMKSDDPVEALKRVLAELPDLG